MLTEIEKLQLSIFKNMGTMSQTQAVEYHDLLVKESIPEVKVEVAEIPVEESKKKKGKK